MNNIVVRLDPYEDADFDQVRDSLDAYPNNSLLWSDNDGDGYADQQGTNISDDRPDTYGSSTSGSLGCLDSDGDSWSDEDDEFPMEEHNGLTLITTDTEITKQVPTRINALLSKDFPDTIGWVVPMRMKMATPILH